MMIVKDFIDFLSKNKSKELLFEYMPGMLVGANYHITEVKSFQVNSVDCGGQADQWGETVVQLWESPEELGKKDFMSVGKALEILNRVSQVKALKGSSTVKIEYSNSQFHTAHLDISAVKQNETQLIISLHVVSTDCKAKELCGLPQESNEGIDQQNANMCTPGGGCC